MKIKVIVFDLDDTLYDEIEYVKSCFKEVSNYFSYKFKIDKNLIYNYMIQDLETNGRGKIFDNMLENFKIYSKENIKKAEVDKKIKLCEKKKCFCVVWG